MVNSSLVLFIGLIRQECLVSQAVELPVLDHVEDCPVVTPITAVRVDSPRLRHESVAQPQSRIWKPTPEMRLALLRGLRYQVHMDKNSMENLVKKLADTVPQGLKSVREDLEQNFRSVLQSGLGKLDLVTREEFEVQEAVLAKAREKLEALEAKLKELE